MKVETFEEIAAEFRRRVERMVWCTVTTVAPSGRPRSRILHPIWEGPVGWIATGRHSPKARDVAHNPYVSLSYWDPQHEQVHAECKAEWIDDATEKSRLWDLFGATPPPVGYDLGAFFPARDSPEYGLLKLLPWKIELWSLADVITGKPPKVWRPQRERYGWIGDALDLRDTAQATSILSLIGRGCRRLAEIAGRLQKPPTSLSRPLQRLVELGFVRRDVPFGLSPRDSKRSLYRLADPLLGYWFRFIEPNRSLLEARQVDVAEQMIAPRLSSHLGETWEDLARASLAAVECHGQRWKLGQRWWGGGLDHHPLELDVVAESADGSALLVGEAKWAANASAPQLLEALRRKVTRFPLAAGREVHLALWLRRRPRTRVDVPIFTPDDVLAAPR